MPPSRRLWRNQWPPSERKRRQRRTSVFSPFRCCRARLAGLSEKRDPTRGGLAKRTRRHRPTRSCQTVRQSPKQRPCLDSTGKTVAGRAGRPIVAASPAVHLNLFLTRLRRVPFSRSVSRDRFDKSNLTSGRKRAQDKGARRKRQTRRKMEIRTWPHFAVGKVAVACSIDRWISLVHTLSLPVEESEATGQFALLWLVRRQWRARTKRWRKGEMKADGDDRRCQLTDVTDVRASGEQAEAPTRLDERRGLSVSLFVGLRHGKRASARARPQRPALHWPAASNFASSLRKACGVGKENVRESKKKCPAAAPLRTSDAFHSTTAAQSEECRSRFPPRPA